MSLRVQFTLEKTELLYQQNAYCTVLLKNIGSSQLAVSVPPMDVSNPTVYLMNVQTGVEDAYQRMPGARKIDPGPGELSPGDDVESGFYLFSIVPELEPGHYDMRITWAYNNGLAIAESETTRIKVLPTTPKNLQMANAFGGHGDLKYAVWINLAGDPNEPPNIIRSRFTLKEGGGVSDVILVASGTVSCKPVLSSPMVGKVAASQWIAWIDNKELHFTHVDDELGVSEPQNLPLALDGIEIIPPLYSAEVEDTRVRPPGGVLLQHSLPEANQFRLDSVQLAPGGAKSLGHLIIPGEKPLWAMSHVLSSKQWLVTYLQKQDGGLLLSYSLWPGMHVENIQPVNLALWKSQLITASACVDAEDTIHGGILMWKTPNDKPRRLVLETWTFKGEDIATKEHPLEWRPNQLIKDARISVSDTGLPAALIADQEGNWFITVNGGELKPLPPEIQKTRQAIEIVFMGGIADPLLVCGTVSRGFNILQLDGSPLPPTVPK